MKIVLIGGIIGMLIPIGTGYSPFHWQWYAMMIPAAITIVAVNRFFKED